MLNYLWAGMILVGIVFGAFNGRMQDITNAALDSQVLIWSVLIYREC